MFFKRAGQDKDGTKKKGEPAVTKAAVSPLQTATTSAPLAASELRRTVDPATLGFKSTADLEPITGLIGQDRALRAIQFGADMKSHDFNMFVLGPPASGKTTAVTAYLKKKAAAAESPADWAYVNNFEDVNRPRALRLPVGRARELARGMVAAVNELRTTLPAAFEAEEYQARRRSLEEEFRSGQEEAFEALNRKAQAQNVAILRTPAGFAMAPTHEGKVVKPEVFNTLPEDMRHAIQAKIESLQKELESILAKVPRSDKERRAKLSALNEEVAEIAVREALDDLKVAFAGVSDVLAYLDAAGADLIRNVGLFLAPSGDENEIVKQSVDVSRDPRFRRYMVNVLVGNDGQTAGAPVMEEINPNYGNLIGRIEHIAQMGALLTDFLLIKPGAFHRANGGYLLLDARKLLLSPFAWEALKRTIKAREIRIEQPAETMGLISTQTLDPEPIPLEVKVVLLGDRELYYLLAAHDPDFPGLFKVQADFDDTIARSQENDTSYARVIASIVATHKLKPVDATGIARLIEEGARMADDREKLSIQVGRLSDLVREADYWSSEGGRKMSTREDVSRAIEEGIQRADRLRDRTQEIIDRNVVLIDTTGSKVGQINALSVLQLGQFSFGRPSRITARVRMGQGRVIDIEREVNLGGPLHSKGMMILWGFLAGRYAEEVPLALAATIGFEQSYGGVDGDSASSTELYALLSALADAPVKQSLAVTGSVNQWGEVQAIGGVNEKIEGFYDVCKARGLTGDQGVLIPASNVQHLMLREEIVEAVSAGKFAVYAVSHVDQGIEILTGIKAGDRGEDRQFPPGTINRMVEDKLKLFAERARAFGKAKDGPMENGKLSS
jgi:lon-related putative ATP-dependent protease